MKQLYANWVGSNSNVYRTFYMQTIQKIICMYARWMMSDEWWVVNGKRWTMTQVSGILMKSSIQRKPNCIYVMSSMYILASLNFFSSLPLFFSFPLSVYDFYPYPIFYLCIHTEIWWKYENFKGYKIMDSRCNAYVYWAGACFPCIENVDNDFIMIMYEENCCLNSL